MRFTRIRYANGTVELVRDTTSGNDTDEHKKVSQDEPRPEFKKALQALGQDVVKICELPKAFLANIEVFGVSIKFKNDRRGVVISAKKPVQLANSPFVIHTPFLLEPDLDDDSEGCLSAATVERLDALITEAAAFASGQRGKQLELLEDGAAPPNENGAGPSVARQLRYAALDSDEFLAALGSAPVGELEQALHDVERWPSKEHQAREQLLRRALQPAATVSP